MLPVQGRAGTGMKHRAPETRTSVSLVLSGIASMNIAPYSVNSVAMRDSPSIMFSERLRGSEHTQGVVSASGLALCSSMWLHMRELGFGLV